MYSKALVIFGLMLTFLTSCYNEPIERPENDNGGYGLECYHGESTGCIQGHIPSAQELKVEDEVFFDADALNQNFSDLLPVVSKGGAKLAADQYKLNLLTKIDNDSFGEGFDVFLKGFSARGETVLRGGSFSINDMRPGLYEVRVQRTVKFTLENIEGADVDKVKKGFCGALYSDAAVEVRRDKRSPVVIFDKFKLYVRNVDCQVDDDSNITLD